jgi:hypothetical protein
MSVPGAIMNLVRSTFGIVGYELVVELSEHSIEIDLERPNKDKRAWDSSLYKTGNVFLSGYANPIKPVARSSPKLENHDKAELIEGEGEETDGEEEQDTEHEDTDTVEAAVIASGRFKTYMKQDLISQMLTPNRQWKLVAYAVGVLALLVLVNVFISMSAAGII